MRVVEKQTVNHKYQRQKEDNKPCLLQMVLGCQITKEGWKDRAIPHKATTHNILNLCFSIIFQLLRFNTYKSPHQPQRSSQWSKWKQVLGCSSMFGRSLAVRSKTTGSLIRHNSHTHPTVEVAMKKISMLPPLWFWLLRQISPLPYPPIHLKC